MGIIKTRSLQRPGLGTAAKVRYSISAVRDRLVISGVAQSCHVPNGTVVTARSRIFVIANSRLPDGQESACLADRPALLQERIL